MTDSSDLSSDEVGRSLVRLAVPMVFGLAAVLSQSLVDTYFVGKLGTVQLAALSFTFPVALIFSSLSIGISAGASSFVSRSIGSGNSDQAKRLTTDSLILSAITITLLSIIGILTIEPFFTLLGASSDVLVYIRRYMIIWYISAPFLVVGIVGHGCMRAAGDGLSPSLIMVGSALINVGLTPALMYGWHWFPELDIEGVAYATLIACATNLFATIFVLYRVNKLFTFAPPGLMCLAQSIQRISGIAFPASFGNVANPIGIAIVTSLLARFGESAVAGYGVATRVEAFACLPMMACAAAVGPIAGQNWGAGKRSNLIKLLKLCYVICFATGALLVALLWFSGELLTSMFTDDEPVQNKAVLYLHCTMLALWGTGLASVCANAFNGIGRPLYAAGILLARTFFLLVPIAVVTAFLLDKLMAVFIGIALAGALGGVASAAWTLVWFTKNRCPNEALADT